MPKCVYSQQQQQEHQQQQQQKQQRNYRQLLSSHPNAQQPLHHHHRCRNMLNSNSSDSCRGSIFSRRHISSVHILSLLFLWCCASSSWSSFVCAERDFNFNDSQVPVLEARDEPPLQYRATPYLQEALSYETELSRCHYADSEILLSLVLKKHDWSDFSETKRSKVLTQISKFFAIPKEFIIMESVTKNDLNEMQQTSMSKGINKCHQNRHLGRINLMLGCGDTYFTIGAPIAKQIEAQMRDGYLDQLTGIRFGWWIIWRKDFSIRAQRNRRDVVEGSGDVDEYGDDYEYEDDVDEEENTDTVTEMPAVTTHAHRHHHGQGNSEFPETNDITNTKTVNNNNNHNDDDDNNEAIVGKNDGDAAVDDGSAAAAAAAAAENVDIATIDSERVASINMKDIKLNTAETTTTITSLLNKNASNIDAEIVESVSQLESVITKTIENTKNIKEVLPVVAEEVAEEDTDADTDTDDDDVVGDGDEENVVPVAVEFDKETPSMLEQLDNEFASKHKTAADAIETATLLNGANEFTQVVTVSPLNRNQNADVAAASEQQISSIMGEDNDGSSSGAGSGGHHAPPAVPHINLDGMIVSESTTSTANIAPASATTIPWTRTSATGTGAATKISDSNIEGSTAVVTSTSTATASQQAIATTLSPLISPSSSSFASQSPTTATSSISSLGMPLITTNTPDASSSSSTSEPIIPSSSSSSSASSSSSSLWSLSSQSVTSSASTATTMPSTPTPAISSLTSQPPGGDFMQIKETDGATTLIPEDIQNVINRAGVSNVTPQVPASTSTINSITTEASAGVPVDIEEENANEVIHTNSPPLINKRLDKFQLVGGKLFTYTPPTDTFYDIEDKTNLRWELTDENGNELKPTSWLQFDAEKHSFYGIPLDSAVHKYEYRLTATDSSNESITDTLLFGVQQHHSVRAFNHEISITVKINDKHLPGVDWQMLLANAIANTLGDVSAHAIVVTGIKQTPQDPSSATFVYFNETLPTSECPEMELNNIVKRLDAKRISDLVNPTLGIKSITGQLIGHCQKSQQSKPKPTTNLSKNNPPESRNQVDLVNATVGQLLIYKVPSDTFYDDDMSTLTLNLKTKDHKQLSPNNWLQFDSKNNEFYGVPLNADAGLTEYMLVAEDAGGLKATDALVVDVKSVPKRDFGVVFKAFLAIRQEQFNADLQRKFVERVAALVGDPHTKFVQMHSVRADHDSDGTVVSFYNNTLYKQHTRCPEEEIESVRSVYLIGNLLRDRVKKELGPELNLTNMQVNLLCHSQTDVPHREFTPTRTEEPTLKSTFAHDYLYTVILPAVIIIVMIIIASIVACCLHRRRHKSGKMELGDEEERKAFRTKGIPVIFQDELDEKPEIGKKSPTILKIEKPPLLPPSNNTTAMNGGDNDVDEYVPPPAVVVGGREARGKSPATPSYRKPPPYVSP